jgi:hypothetical protein
LALIWPQCLTNKTVKTAFNSRLSPVYFAIRRANIAFVAEYVLYAMPGEEAYGKNDIVFACEGFLPLVLDPQLVLEPQSWKLFNELKVQVLLLYSHQTPSSLPLIGPHIFFYVDLYSTTRSERPRRGRLPRPS